MQNKLNQLEEENSNLKTQYEFLRDNKIAEYERIIGKLSIENNRLKSQAVSFPVTLGDITQYPTQDTGQEDEKPLYLRIPVSLIRVGHFGNLDRIPHYAKRGIIAHIEKELRERLIIVAKTE